jgi:hypothetical protein
MRNIRASDSKEMAQSTSPQMAAALRAAQRRADGSVEELSSLCLLPLMINKVDPSLPLLLFSSTHTP